MARQDEIVLAQRDRDYVDHEQYTREERKTLNERGQPIITINKIADKLQLLCGMERKARTDPKASLARRPRKTAPRPPPRRCATSPTTTRSRSSAVAVFNNMLVEGRRRRRPRPRGRRPGRRQYHHGAGSVGSHLLRSAQHGRWTSVTRATKGLVIWTDRDQLEETYPDADDVIEASVQQR